MGGDSSYASLFPRAPIAEGKGVAIVPQRGATP